MKKITISLDVGKISKDKILERTYKNKEGEEVKQKIYKFDLIELNDPKFVAQGDNWILKKTHFCTEPQSKEDKEAKKPINYVGEGLVFESKEKENLDAF